MKRCLQVAVLLVIGSAVFGQLTFDQIFIGAGTAGSVAAAHCAKTNPKKTIAIFDAGPSTHSEFPDDASLSAISYQLCEVDKCRTAVQGEVPHHTRMLFDNGRFDVTCKNIKDATQGCCIGGSSCLSALVWIESCPQMIEHWNISDISWPVFSAAQESMRQTMDPRRNGFENSALDRFMDVLNQTGLSMQDFNNCSVNRDHSFQRSQYTIKNGTRRNTATEKLKPVLDGSRVQLFANAEVRRILINNETMTAEGVEVYFKKSGEIRQFWADEIILSAGPINTPAILIESGVGPKDLVEDAGVPLILDVPQLGTGKDPPTLYMHFTWGDLGKDLPPVANGQFHVAEYTFNQTGILTSTGYEVHLMTMTTKGIMLEMQLIVNDGNTVTISMFPTTTNSTFNLTLEDGQFKVNPQTAEDEIDALVEGVLFVRTIMTHFQGNSCPSEELSPCAGLEQDNLRACVANSTSSASHYCCTARIGNPDDPTRVVDSSTFGFIGIKNLKIVCSSMHPQVSEQSPYSAVCTMAQIAAERICPAADHVVE